MNIEMLAHHLFLGFDPGTADDLASAFSQYLDWGIEASKGYLAFVAATALAVYLFKR